MSRLGLEEFGRDSSSVNNCCTRVLLYAKMLKETENEETRLFCQIFVSGAILSEETRAPLAIPMATPMILK